MKYIVTGGAGFIGSHLSDALAENGHKVVIIDDLSSGKKENIQHLIHPKSNVTFIYDTITNGVTLRKIFDGADGIFHQAALVSVPKSIIDPVYNHDINLTGTLNVLTAARASGVKKVVFASSAAVYGNLPGLPKREDMPANPVSPYGLAKLTSEYYCMTFSELYNLSTISLRYFNVYGPRQDHHSDYAAVIPKFYNRLSNGKYPIIFGDGEQTRDFIYVKDVIQANIQAMETEATGVYNIASGKAISVNSLARILIKLFNLEGDPEYINERPGDVKMSYADISKARNAFGFNPKFTLEMGLQEMIRLSK